MQRFSVVTGVAVPMELANIDTDVIIPVQYTKTVSRGGLGRGLFHNLRYLADGNENPDFVLNKPAYRGAKILVAGENFGAGSSREHAAWALLDFGIQCVISSLFADIFYTNCINTGVLPVAVSPDELQILLEDMRRREVTTLTVDLPAQQVILQDGLVLPFEIDPARKHRLLNGLDDLDSTLEERPTIDEFVNKRHKERHWL